MKAKNIIIYVLIALCLYLGLKITFKNKEILLLESKNAVIPYDVKRQVIVTKRQVVYKYRKPDGSSTEDKAASVAAVQKNYYLPPEGSLKIEQTLNDDFNIKLINKGLTFGLFAGGALDIEGQLNVLAGARLFYYNRYGLGVSVNNTGKFMITADRRIDDVLPLLQNTSLAFHAGKNYAALGLSIYF